jgi:outer membrane biosynthesis protein TonB
VAESAEVLSGWGAASFAREEEYPPRSCSIKVEPEYSEEARKAKYRGTVVVYAEVQPNGRAVNLRIIRSLGLGFDERA